MDFCNMWNRLKRLISITFQDLSNLCEMRYGLAARNFENASQAYLFRDWSNQTLMNLGRISSYVSVHLRHVYLTLYCILGFLAIGALGAWWLLPLGNMGGLSTRLLFFTNFTLFVSREPWDESAQISGKVGAREPVKTKIEKQNEQRVQPDVRVWQLKDQLIREKVYLSLAATRNNPHFIRELRLRMKEVQRALGEATNDSELPRNAYEKLKSMEQTLAKGKQIQDDCTTVTFILCCSFIVSAAVALSIPLGCFVVASLVTRHRDYMYIGGLLSCLPLIPIWLHFASIIFGGYTAIYKFKLCYVILLYVGLIVVSSQQIIRRVQRGDYDYVQHALPLLADFAYICTILSVFYFLWKEASEKEREKQLNSTSSSSSDWIEAVLLDPN
ncbi:unnamed protein product, partial [Ilex paraguariensis]